MGRDNDNSKSDHRRRRSRSPVRRTNASVIRTQPTGFDRSPRKSDDRVHRRDRHYFSTNSFQVDNSNRTFTDKRSQWTQQENSRTNSGNWRPQFEHPRSAGSSFRRAHDSSNGEYGNGGHQQQSDRGWFVRQRGMMNKQSLRSSQSTQSRGANRTIIYRPGEQINEKPTLNLFDPCKVPKGRMYFTHDFREQNDNWHQHSGRGSMRGGGGRPYGWRTDQRSTDRRTSAVDSNSSSLQRRPSDNVWKHDMFVDDDAPTKDTSTSEDASKQQKNDEDGRDTELAEFEKFPDGPTLTEAQLSHDIEHGHVYGFIAFVDDDHTAAGMTLFYLAYSTWEGQYIHMEDLYVRPRYRRIGIGRALCRAIAQLAKQRNMKRMQWNVLNWNKGAIKLYEQMDATNLHHTEGWITYRLTPSGIEQLANSQ